MTSHRIFVGTFDDGSQLLITQWLNADGTIRSTTAATRPHADPRIVWGPPIELTEPE